MVDSLSGSPASLLLVVAGLVACLAGYRLFRLVLTVAGFFGGALLASAVFSSGSVLIEALALLAGGLVGAAVMLGAYFFGVALVGAVLGAMVAHLWVAGADREPTVLLIVLSSVGGALFTMVLQRYVLIAGTAFAGAWAAVAGALIVMGHSAAAAGGIWVPSPSVAATGGRWVSVSWLALAAVGVVVQLGWTAGEKGRLSRRRTARRNE